MASPNLSEIVTTTLRNRTGKLADNMKQNIALLNRMNRAGDAALVVPSEYLEIVITRD